MYVVLPYVIVALAVYTAIRAYALHRWGDAVFAAVNARPRTYAIVAFVGLRNSLVDIWVNLVSLLYKPPGPRGETAGRAGRRPRPAPRCWPPPDWERILYVGSVDHGQHAPPHPSKAIDEGEAPEPALVASLGSSEEPDRRRRYRTAGSFGLASGWRLELRRPAGENPEPGD